MSNKKKSNASAAPSLIRSSAAEYLTFVAASGAGGVEAVYAEENVWLTQKMIGQLYNVDVRTISYHLKNIFADHELAENAVIQLFRITAADGKTYNTQHYNLAAIISVGYKVNSERAVQFRKWATGIIESFTIKGFAMDDEPLKNDGSVHRAGTPLCQRLRCGGAKARKRRPMTSAWITATPNTKLSTVLRVLSPALVAQAQWQLPDKKLIAAKLHELLAQHKEVGGE
jgi:hypothetical protein